MAIAMAHQRPTYTIGSPKHNLFKENLRSSNESLGGDCLTPCTPFQLVKKYREVSDDLYESCVFSEYHHFFITTK